MVSLPRTPELEDSFPALSQGAHPLSRCPWVLGVSLLCPYPANLMVRPVAPILEQVLTRQSPAPAVPGETARRSAICWRARLARAAAGCQRCCGREVGGDCPQPAAEETQAHRCWAVRRGWNPGHCYPARTFPAAARCMLLIAEMNKFHRCARPAGIIGDTAECLLGRLWAPELFGNSWDHVLRRGSCSFCP